MKTLLTVCLCTLGIALVLGGAYRILLLEDWSSYPNAAAAAAPQQEGFSQTQPFLLRRDDQCYDDFYAAVYSRIHYSCAKDDDNDNETFVQYHVNAVVDATQADRAHAAILDVGCGSGDIVEAFAREGFRAYGLDKSAAMIDECRRARQAGAYKIGDVLDPMCYDAHSFTHILLVNQMIYSFNKKQRQDMLRICRTWLKNSGGYLVVHVIDFDNQEKNVGGGVGGGANVGSTLEIDETGFLYNGKRISAAAEAAADVTVTALETFVDKPSGHVRRHEKQMFIESQRKVVSAVKTAGFSVLAKISLRPLAIRNQYLYIFEKSI